MTELNWVELNMSSCNPNELTEERCFLTDQVFSGVCMNGLSVHYSIVSKPAGLGILPQALTLNSTQTCIRYTPAKGAYEQKSKIEIILNWIECKCQNTCLLEKCVKCQFDAVANQINKSNVDMASRESRVCSRRFRQAGG